MSKRKCPNCGGKLIKCFITGRGSFVKCISCFKLFDEDVSNE